MTRTVPPWESIGPNRWHRPSATGSFVRVQRATDGDPLCGIGPTWKALGWLPPNRGDSDLWTRDYATPAEAQRDIDGQLLALGWPVEQCAPIETPPLDVPFIGPVPASTKGGINVIDIERTMRALMPTLVADQLRSAPMIGMTTERSKAA